MRQFSFHGSGGKKHPASLCGDEVESSVSLFLPPMLPALITAWLPNQDNGGMRKGFFHSFPSIKGGNSSPPFDINTNIFIKSGTKPGLFF
jgi:hypothetical protein